MRKYSLFLILVLTILMVGSFTLTVHAEKPIKLFVNGFETKTDVPPQMINNRMLVPVRWVAEALGYNVTWDGANRAVHIFKDYQAEASKALEDNVNALTGLVNDYNEFEKSMDAPIVPDPTPKLEQFHKTGSDILVKLVNTRPPQQAESLYLQSLKVVHLLLTTLELEIKNNLELQQGRTDDYRGFTMNITTDTLRNELLNATNELTKLQKNYTGQ